MSAGVHLSGSAPRKPCSGLRCSPGAGRAGPHAPPRGSSVGVSRARPRALRGSPTGATAVWAPRFRSRAGLPVSSLTEFS